MRDNAWPRGRPKLSAKERNQAEDENVIANIFHPSGDFSSSLWVHGVFVLPRGPGLHETWNAGVTVAVAGHKKGNQRRLATRSYLSG